MIDNIQLIKELLNFEEEGDFYMLYVFKRKKDQPEENVIITNQSEPSKLTVSDLLKDLEDRYDEIKQLCEMFSAKAYIHVQKQNHRDVALNMMVELRQRIQNDQHNQAGLFDSVVGKIKTIEKRWIVDIDTKDPSYLIEVVEFINTICPPFRNRSEIHTHTNDGVSVSYDRVPKCLKIIPTKNGYHLITEKFDVMKFRENYPHIDIVKKNPTLLYLPEILDQD